MNPFNYEKLEIARLLRQKTQKDVVKDVGISQVENAEDLIKSLPNDAENYVRGLTRNQQENFKEAYASGNIAWQPLIVDKKSGAKSGGFFVDLNAKTPLGITISNTRRKEK